MNKNTETLLAFLAGAATGAILGVLFAPDKGKNTRDKLSYQLENYRDKLKEVLDQLLHEHANTPAKEEGEKVVSEAKGKAEKLLHDVELLIEEIRTQKVHA